VIAASEKEELTSDSNRDICKVRIKNCVAAVCQLVYVSTVCGQREVSGKCHHMAFTMYHHGENDSSDTIELGFTLLLMRENDLCYDMLP